MHPGPYSLRELLWMVESQRQEAWSQVAWLTAHIVNSGFGVKQLVQPVEVNPMIRKKQNRLSGKEAFRELMGLVL